MISITDGQIYLEPDLFNAGVRPAINVGISVSRVGGNAQIKAMKSAAGMLRLDLAQYRDLEAFAKFGSDLDPATQRQLRRGERLVELLKQGQFNPVPVEEQIAVIYVGGQGLLDSIAMVDIKRFESEFIKNLQIRTPEALASIRETGKLSDETKEAFREEAKRLTALYTAETGKKTIS